MPLVLTVALIVLGVIALVAVVGTIIDNAEEKVEHPENMPRDRHDRV
jgi:cytochrome c biogenesis protein ResB